MKAEQANSLRRDVGIDRLRRTTTWVGAAAVALIGVFSAAVATALPGHGQASPPARNAGSLAPSSTTTARASPSVTSPTQLQPPTTPPSTAPPATAPQAVSGGS